jgi:large subunit ribosomal protein L6
MSKIGRKPINIGATQVEIKGNAVYYKGKKDAGHYELPEFLVPKLDGSLLKLTYQERPEKKVAQREINRVWGLCRALLANRLKGAQTEFEKQVTITGLGFKATASGSKIVFSLGYSHKIDYTLPKGVTVEIDKTGQKLVFKSADPNLLGDVCSEVGTYRKQEPYKGTGIKVGDKAIARKAGKTKAS